jgi:hypothetical protein
VPQLHSTQTFPAPAVTPAEATPAAADMAAARTSKAENLFSRTLFILYEN